MFRVLSVKKSVRHSEMDVNSSVLIFLAEKRQGPVVQSIVSLTSFLRGQLVKCFTTLLLHVCTLMFFVETIREAFAKASLIFSTKYIGICRY